MLTRAQTARSSLPLRSGEVQASWLGTGERAVFTLLHHAAEVKAEPRAVLICPPFGWAEACSYRDLRDWARALAAAGHPCARMWPPGVGNSGGSPRDPGQFDAWVHAVGEAAQWLDETVSARRVVALGIGLGGMLACLAAQRGARIDDLILWGVPARGRTLLRQDRLFADVVTAAANEQISAELGPEDGLQLVGYRLNAQSVASIQGTELEPEALAGDADRRVLLIGRDGVAVDTRLRDGFERTGAEVTVIGGADWLQLVGTPQQSVAPHRTIEATIAWLGEGQRSGAAPAARNGTHRVRGAAVAVVDEAGAVRERVVRFSGPIEGGFGVVSEPTGGQHSEVTAVWCTAHHAGPSRMWVEIARRWAARGVTTVRVDFMGQGESDGPSPRPLPDSALYLPERGAQLRALLDQLAEWGMAPRFILGGYCAGAYWALRAAVDDPRVCAAMLINLFAFRYGPEFVAEYQTGRALADLGGRRSAGAGFSAADARLTLRKLRLRYRHGHLSRAVERLERSERERVVEVLAARGIETLLVLCRHEALLERLQRQVALARLMQCPTLTVDQLPSPDHLMWDLHVQRLVHESVDRALARTLAGALNPAGAR